MRTIAVLNQKGGVGKTTTVANTAAALASMGSKVLAIDLDPQAHLTIHLGLEPQSIEAGSYKVLIKSAEVADEIVQSRENLWLLPANINLVGAETELVSVVGREIILREALEKVEDRFDYCLIDCPPSLGLLTLNSLAAAQEVLIPLQPHFLALQGVGKLLQTVELVNKRINPKLRVEGILLCMFDTRASLPSEVRADIEEFLKNARGTNCAWAEARILPTFIRRNIKLAEAPSYGKTIFEYEQNCHGAEDYKAVAEFIHKGSRSHGQVQTPEPAPTAIQDIPKPPEPVATTPQQTPTQTPEPVVIKPVQVPAKSPEPPQPIRQASNPLDNPTPTALRPIAQPLSEPKSSPAPRLTSTYEYHPQPPAPRNPQAPQQPSNINGAKPIAGSMPAAPQNTQPQPPRPPQPIAINGRAPQAPVRNIPPANGNPQPTLQPKPQLNDTYQYRAAAPTPNMPVPPRSIQPQPQPKPPMSSTNGLQGPGPIQNAPAAPDSSQIPPRPNPQPVTRDTVSHKAPIEIRQIPRSGSLTPQQQAAKQNNGQPPAARIIEITPLNQPKPIAKPDRATPAEPTQGS